MMQQSLNYKLCVDVVIGVDVGSSLKDKVGSMTSKLLLQDSAVIRFKRSLDSSVFHLTSDIASISLVSHESDH